MAGILVSRGIQFRPDLNVDGKHEWFTAVGAELAARKLKITLAPGIEISDVDSAVAVYVRFKSDPDAFKQAIGSTDPTFVIDEYIYDLLEVLDDFVTAETTVREQTIDLSLGQPLATLTALATPNKSYAQPGTTLGDMPKRKIMTVMGLQMSRTAWQPDEELKGQAFIMAATLPPPSGPEDNSARDADELEKAYGVVGMDGRALIGLLRSKDSEGRTLFQRVRKNESGEAFSLGYVDEGTSEPIPLDEVRWDENSHALRMQNKLVSLVIENGRFAVDPESGKRKLTLGTDKNDDAYNDVKGSFGLHDLGFLIRARARYDTDTEPRRALLGVKTGTTIDEFGVKRCRKMDTRIDGATPEQMADLNFYLQSGEDFSGQPFQAMRVVYDAAVAHGLTRDIGVHKGVMQLETKAYIRSVRARFHLNETSLLALTQHFKTLASKLPDDILVRIETPPASVSEADRSRLSALCTKLNNMHAVIRDKLPDAMKFQSDQAMSWVPTIIEDGGEKELKETLVDTRAALDQRETFAKAIDAAYSEVAKELAELRDVVAGPREEKHDAMADAVIDFYKAMDTDDSGHLRAKTAPDAFLAELHGLLKQSPGQQAKVLQAMNAFGQTEIKAEDLPGISDGPQDRVNDGSLKLIDPIAVLRAWGFQLADGLVAQWEGDGAKPQFDPTTHVTSKT